MEEVPTASALRRLKVVELRQRLSKLSLPQAGIKEELISRLINYYEEQYDAQQEKEDEEDTKEEDETDQGRVTQPGTEEVEAMDTGECVEQPCNVLSGEAESPEHSEAATDPSTGEGIAVAPAATTDNQQSDNQQSVDPAVSVEEEEEEEDVQATVEGPEEGRAVEGEGGSSDASVEVEGGSEDQVPSSSVDEREQQQPMPQAILTAQPEPNQLEMDEEDTSLERLEMPTVTDNMHTASAAVNSIMTSSFLPQPLTTLTAHPLTTLSPQLLTAPTPLFPRAVTSDYYSDSSQDTQQQQQQQQQQQRRQPEGVSNEQGPLQSAPAATNGETAVKEKRKKKKKRRRRRHDNPQPQTTPSQENSVPERSVEIEYIHEDVLQLDDPNYRHFHHVMESFKLADPSKDKKVPREGLGPLEAARLAVADATRRVKEMRAEQLKQGGEEDEEEEEEEGGQREEEEEEEKAEEDEAPKLSKKQLRRLNRLTVAQLKQLVERPDVVEMHDVTAHDPKLLVVLKSTRNSVPVPRHWCFKRKYLQGKRGIEKPPFDLPDFIKSTGVMEMRQAHDEKEDAKSLKQKTRERVRPKMGKLTIDYQKLHDAFFKWQTKPSMSIHGDLYYEGKEFETRLRQKRPGDLSDDMRRALGMPTGAGKHRFPPPWLVAMQRYGPPPSYPNLKIPGLSAPIPEGCSFGYFVGGWGKPPVDEKGRPLYGDVFGLDQPEGHGMHIPDDTTIDKSYWGELESEEEEEEEEEESEEDGAEEKAPRPEDIQAGLVTPLEGLVTPSGLTSIPAGLETPEMIQLRKKKIEEAMEQGGETPTLYTVLPEKPSAVGAAMMGSSHVYDVASAVPGAPKKGSGPEGGVAVALDISELDMDSATMSARYEQQMREQQGQLQKEDLSDMVAEHAAKQKKRKRATADSGGSKATKKLKEFKF